MKKTWLQPIFIFAALSLLFFALVGQILNHCHPYNDIGIYAEALRLIQWGNWNPFIPGRFLHIFNDHFDPILIPFSLLARWVPAPILGVTLEYLIIGACWFPIHYLIQKNKISWATGVFSYAFLVLNHAMVDALFRPFHPTTWGLLPLLYVFAFYWTQNFKGLLVALILLFACREEFPLVGLSLSVALWFDPRIKTKMKWFVPIFALSLVWTIFAFKVRPAIFEGTFSNYGGSLLSDFIARPIERFKAIFNIGNIRMFLSRVIPIVLLLRVSAIKKHIPHATVAFIIALPIFGVRFAANAWAAHYGSAAVFSLLFMVWPALDQSMRQGGKQWRPLIAWGFLLITFFSPVIKNSWDNWFANGGYQFGHKHCLNKPERLSEIKTAQTWIDQSGHRKVLLEGNLIATQMILSHGKDLEFHYVGGPSSGHRLEHEVVFVEKPPSGDPWPIGMDRMKELIPQWRNAGLHIIMDNEYVFLAEGKIRLDQ